jgi:hypothetical protein
VAYFASSSTINSSSNLYWDNTNTRLGIGNSSPSYTLDVSGTGRFTGNTIIGTRTTGNIRNLNIYGGTNNNAILKLDGADGNGYGAQLEFISKNSGGTSNTWVLGTGINFADNDFEFYNGTSNILFLKQNGNIGIGISTITAWNGNAGTVVSQYSSGNTNTIYSAQSNATSVDTGAAFEGYSANTTSGSKALGSINFLRENTSTTALSSYTGFYSNNAGTVAEKMRITSGGNVGIGITPSAWSQFTAIQLGGNSYSALASSNNYIIVSAGTYYDGTNFKYTTTGEATRFQQSGGGHYFYTAPSGTAGGTVTFTQGLSVTSGSVQVGVAQAATNVNLDINGVTNKAGRIRFLESGAAQWLMGNGAASENGRFEIYDNSSGTGVQLLRNATAWVPLGSDIRLKKNFETTQGLAELLQIEPVKYHLLNEDDNTSKKLGFIAQNLQPLIPEMVVTNGRKADDGTDYLTIVPDYLLPVLVKAIQEMNTKIIELEKLVATK